MALNAYTIYGNPLPGETRSEDDINAEKIIGDDESLEVQRNMIANQAPVHFVPAKGDYDELGRLKNAADLLSNSRDARKGPEGVGNWYSSLQRTRTDPSKPRSNIKVASKPSTSSQTPAAATSDSSPPAPVPGPSVAQKRPNWFKSAPNPNNADGSSNSTLADMIRRDPPNPQNPMTPPVYYAIGPSNRGYEILSKGGWEEGQPLGRRRGLGSGPARKSEIDQPSSSSSSEDEGEEKWGTLGGGMPKLLVPRGTGQEVDVVDLAGAPDEESEEETYERDGKLFKALHTSEHLPPPTPPADLTSREVSVEQELHPNGVDGLGGSHFDKPLLTPIAVALKNDRTGLGLSKSKRLVTHSSLALHHHIQQGKLEKRHHVSEMRRMERDHQRGEYGRGKRAYARMAKEEAEKRKKMMEYMNT